MTRSSTASSPSPGDSGVLMTFKPDIDPQNGKVDQIKLDGAPEFLAADGAGRVFDNLEDKDVVAVVDLNSQKVMARWPVAPGRRPVGTAMDVKSHRLLIGCRKPQMLVVMNTENGKIKGSVPTGAGVDATGFHNGQAFASCRDGSLVVAEESCRAGSAADCHIPSGIFARCGCALRN